MKPMLKLIKELIFGPRCEPVDVISTGLHTIEPENKPSFEKWCKEFNVGMLYDRKTIHIN
jgi:hypothetical protein